MKDETEDLNLHVQICTQRYLALDSKLESTHDRINSVENKVSDLNKTVNAHFLDLKLSIQAADSRRDVQVIATLGSVAVAIIAVIGYLITH